MITEEVYDIYKENLLNGRRNECSNIVRQLLEDGIELKDLYVHLFQRSLYYVGTLWETNQITVAMEHLYTSITESLISMSYPYLFAKQRCGRKAVILCTPGEFHQIGARMVADYFELNGWDGYFIGVNTPEEDLIKLIDKYTPDILAISLSFLMNLKALRKLILTIRESFKELKIIVGGQGFRDGGSDTISEIDNVQVILTLEELEKSIFENEIS